MNFHKNIFLVITSCFSCCYSSSQIIISEASAKDGWTEIMGETCDWIELRNDGEEAVNLEGFRLNDEFEYDNGWEFPYIELQSGQRLLIASSGLDKPYMSQNWQCPAIDSDTWDYIVPTSNPLAGWNEPGFNSIGWSLGQGGFGYGDNDDATVLEYADVIFIKKSFYIEDPLDWGYMSLAVDYDDGYIAYLNGNEVSRSTSMNGVLGDYNDFSNTYVEANLYQNLLPEQRLWDESEFSNWLVPGENVLAFQVHNDSPESSDLTIRPFLGMTRKDGEPSDWMDPPAWWPEYSALMHTSFKLSPGESVVLWNSEGEQIDALPIHPDIVFGHSVGRPEGNSEDWCIFDTPSPGEVNPLDVCYNGFETAPDASAPSGWYTSPLNVQIIEPSSGQDVRYTMNGDIPNTTDPIFPSDGLNIYSSNVLSLRSFSTSGNSLPSEVQDYTYIINEFTPDIPTFSIITDENNLWDWETGIYVSGPNAGTDYPYFGANFWEPWSRLARIEFFDENGVSQEKGQLDLEIHGGWSRAEPQRSFRLDFRNEYTGDFDYPIFEDTPQLNSFNNLNLRNGGQHSWGTKFQDGMYSQLARTTHNVASNWRPVILYLNGDFWGLYGVRQKSDEHFIANEFLTNDDEVDLIGPNGLLNGSDEDFYTSTSLLLATPTLDENFATLFEDKFDVKNYMDYFIFETYAQNIDWMGLAWGLNNVKTFRSAPNMPWRYILYDTDESFGYFDNNVNANYIEWARNPGFPTVHSNLFNRFLEDIPLRLRFINRYADLVNTIFQPDVFNAMVLDAKESISETMPHHIDRWDSPPTILAWESYIDNLIAHNELRVGTSREHLMNSFELPDNHECLLDVYPPMAGEIRINTIVPSPLPWHGIYFEDCPIEIEANATNGWMFDHWESNNHTISGDMNENERVNTIPLHTHDIFLAKFITCPLDASTSISYNAGILDISTTNIPYIDSVAWFFNGEFVGTGMNWIPDSKGQYSAEIYFDGCFSNSEEFDTGNIETGAYYDNETFILWPNPASDVIELVMPTNSPFSIYNSIGQCVWEYTVSGNTSYGRIVVAIPTQDWPDGTYFVLSGPNALKFVIQQ